MGQYFDFHCHNGYSRCVKHPWAIREGWQIARERGLAKLGITNHIHYNSPIQDFLPQLKTEIEAVERGNILLGVELDIDSEQGHCVLQQETYGIVDYVIAGPHNQPLGFLMMPDTTDEDVVEYFASLRNILTNSLKNIKMDVWVHPFYQELGNFGDFHWKRFLRPIYLECLEICANKGIAIEITPDYHRDLSYPVKIDKWRNEDHFWWSLFNVIGEIYSLAAQKSEIKFSPASDAHELEKIGDIWYSYNVIHSYKIPKNRILDITHKKA